MNKDYTMDYAKILLKDPLLSEYVLVDVNELEILNLLFHISENETYGKLKIIDSFCPICKKDTTFVSENTDQQELNDLLISAGMFGGSPGSMPENRLIEKLEEKCVFIRKFKCPRKPNDSAHNQIFIFRVIGTTLIKIGQHPSIADLSKEEIKKYRKLNNDIYKELNRAIGLSSHGVGVGSFVYLRRIIEKHIVIPKLQELLSERLITNEKLAQSDFKEKIKLLKEKLPDFLVNNNKIYSILSKGLHELTEDECKEYFPILRTSIEIILDEQIEKQEREKKSEIIAKQLNSIK